MASSSGTRKRKAEDSGNKDDKLIKKATDVIDFLDKNRRVLSVAEDTLVDLIRPGVNDIVNEVFRQSTVGVLSLRFPVEGDQKTRAATEYINAELDLLLKDYQKRLEYANAIPPPSVYARHSIWVDWQQKATAILCFRPSDKQGLPLCVLDNVFREFQRQVRTPLPSTPDARKAMNAAFDLCQMMPNHFDKESDRGKVFDKCLDPILPLFSWRSQVHIEAPTELRTGQVGRMYDPNGVVLILREDKLETGSGDDVYMQVSRDYQLYVEKVRAKDSSLLEQGVPVFLLCVLGPILLICGGFHDTKSTIVEPLVEPCLMFGDCLHFRQEALAGRLFALKQALDTLRSRSPSHGPTVNPHPAGVPRIYTKYTTYTTEDTTERSLTFLRPLEKSVLPQPLLFIAIDQLEPSTPKLVKLVGKDYGVRVHQLLAEQQFAPVLYGQSSLEGAPTAYIMEYLSPPTDTESGWMTLFKFSLLENLNPQYSHPIRNALEGILTMMEKAEVVHGDLRPNNIMLEVNSDRTPICLEEEQKVKVKLRVVDFDWAGQSGQVCYPLQRNENITWPGDAGMPIVVGHDRSLVESWWFKHFPSM